MSPNASWEQLLSSARFVDLSQPLTSGIPHWPTHPPYQREEIESYRSGAASLHYRIDLDEHTGTHLDAPIHFIDGAATVDEIPLDRSVLQAALLRASELQVASRLTADHISAWEGRNAPIERGAAVVIDFGWARRWDDGTFLDDWPGVDRSAAELLVDRGVSLVAVDVVSADPAEVDDFAAHRTLLGAGILIGENFTNLNDLPTYFTLLAIPLRLHGGSGSPVRAVALVSEDEAV